MAADQPLVPSNSNCSPVAGLRISRKAVLTAPIRLSVSNSAVGASTVSLTMYEPTTSGVNVAVGVAAPNKEAEDPTGLDSNSQSQVVTSVLSLFVKTTGIPKDKSSRLVPGGPGTPSCVMMIRAVIMEDGPPISAEFHFNTRLLIDPAYLRRSPFLTRLDSSLSKPDRR